MAELLASATVPKMTLVAVWANAPEFSAMSKRQTERKHDTVDTSFYQSDYHHPWLLARTVHPQRIFVHHFVAAANILFGQKAFHEADFEVDAVYEDPAGIAYRPVGAKDKPILAKSSPQKLRGARIQRGIGHGLELRKAREMVHHNR